MFGAARDDLGDLFAGVVWGSEAKGVCSAGGGVDGIAPVGGVISFAVVEKMDRVPVFDVELGFQLQEFVVQLADHLCFYGPHGTRNVGHDTAGYAGKIAAHMAFGGTCATLDTAEVGTSMRKEARDEAWVKSSHRSWGRCNYDDATSCG